MIDDKIILVLQEIRKLRFELKEIKKDVKKEEKIVDEEYVIMKKTAKEMKEQVKDFEENWNRELRQDEDYKKLIEMQMEKDEDIANRMAELYDFVRQLPQKLWETNMDTEEGPVRVQIQPEMRVYLNGREEKRRI
ncbi:MAG: hypothetical protein Q8P27_01605 [Candidatus Peregrinibacteria bacterium]|nr:hypothetical protein [Candidatus Peregrinibacteria bacterium]